MDTYIHTPAAVQELSGWSAELIRDYRLKRYLESYGKKGENGRWLYSGRDMVAFWAAAILHGRGKAVDIPGERLPGQRERPIDLYALFDHSWIIAEFVAKHIAGREAPVYWGFGDVTREKVMTPWGEGLSLHEPVRFRADTLTQIEKLNLYALDLVNTKALASFAPPKLISMVAAMNFDKG
ncbi:hypothetical protein [Pararhodobacter aggregans]